MRSSCARPDTIRIMLTGHANTDAVMGAINDGAVYKFILKPWNDDDLRVTVALALEQFDLIARNKRPQNRKRQEEQGNLGALQAGGHPPQPARHHAAQEKPALGRPVAGTQHTSRSAASEPLIALLLEKDWVE
jgi:DNA-binding NtrC family response regulator